MASSRWKDVSLVLGGRQGWHMALLATVPIPSQSVAIEITTDINPPGAGWLYSITSSPFALTTCGVFSIWLSMARSRIGRTGLCSR